MLAAEGEHLDNALRIAAVIENRPSRTRRLTGIS